MTAETARVPSCLILSTRFTNEEERKGHGFGAKSIWVSQKLHEIEGIKEGKKWNFEVYYREDAPFTLNPECAVPPDAIDVRAPREAR